MSYFIPPTAVDEENAARYADNKSAKRVCELPQFKGIFEWKEDPVVPYPCPAGLTCNSGKCVFTEQGCRDTSSMPFYDCARREVSCYLPREKPGANTCSICEFQIDGGKVVTGPTLAYAKPGDLQTHGCAPGDLKYLRRTNPEDDVDPETDTSNYMCQGAAFDPDAYKMRTSVPRGTFGTCQAACAANMVNYGPGCAVSADKPDADASGNCTCDCSVGCTEDDHCMQYGVGGSCMLYEYLYDTTLKGFSTTNKTKAYKQCVDTGAPYLEYRKNYTQWSGVRGTDMCVMTTPMAKKWCEMPWTRTGSKKDLFDKNIDTRIKAQPQVKRHPPFFYNEDTGKCMMTKSYCTKSTADGGFNTGFGDKQSYLAGMVTDCQNPGHNNFEVREGYDCCIPMGLSIASFFTGRNMLVSLQNAINGEITFSEFWNEFGGPLSPVVDGWLSEDALKVGARVVAADLIAPGVSLYEFEWHPDAALLYPDAVFPPGRRLGLLASEVARAVPQYMVHTEYGHRKLALSQAAWDTDATYRRCAKAMAMTDRAAAAAAAANADAGGCVRVPIN